MVTFSLETFIYGFIAGAVAILIAAAAYAEGKNAPQPDRPAKSKPDGG